MTPTFEDFKSFVQRRAETHGPDGRYEYGLPEYCAFAQYLKTLTDLRVAVGMQFFNLNGVRTKIDSLKVGLADAIYNGNIDKYYDEADSHLLRTVRIAGHTWGGLLDRLEVLEEI